MNSDLYVVSTLEDRNICSYLTCYMVKWRAQTSFLVHYGSTSFEEELASYSANCAQLYPGDYDQRNGICPSFGLDVVLDVIRECCCLPT